MSAPTISIIVPTLNEAENLPALARRIAATLGNRRYELLIVDDSSTDGTPQVCENLAATFPLTLITRAPKDGLSGAVLEGIAHSLGQYLVVMDADLQHPPEKIPQLLAPLEANHSEFVIGSRYVPGASTGKKWTLFRKLNSRAATLLAKPFAGQTHDPMSGFFALKRETFDRATDLTPLGYKIALELICKTRASRVTEIPIDFATRQAGVSKLNIKQQFKYLEHLSRLYDFFFPRISPVLKFLIATACAWFVGFAIYALALAKTQQEGLVAPPPAVAIAYAAAIITTAVFHLRYTRTQREFLIRPNPWRDFTLISLCEWATACAIAIFCSRRIFQITALELFFYSFLAATITRYILRKEFLQDIRGLSKSPRPAADSTPRAPANPSPAKPSPAAQRPRIAA